MPQKARLSHQSGERNSKPLKIGLPEIENVGRAPCAAEGLPKGEDSAVPEPKIRAAHGIGPVDRGVFMGNVPASRMRTPSSYADLADERQGGLARELRDFSEGLGPAKCDNCRSRWFSSKPKFPGWEIQELNRQKL